MTSGPRRPQADWFAAWVVDGVHRIAQFSVGGDVGLSLLQWGTPTFGRAGSRATVFPSTAVGGNSIGSSRAFVRWYF